MRNKFTKLALAALAFTIVFNFSCSSDGFYTSAWNPSGGTSLLQNATERTGELPRGTTGTLDVQMNNTIISGGSTILTVTSDREINKLYIQFANNPGSYYELNISQSDLISSLGGIYIYNVLLQFAQGLLGQSSQTTESMQISFSATAGSEVSPSTSTTVEAVRVGAGALQISLSWNTGDDLDLHVTPPSGGTIYFDNKRVGNGELDRDVIPGCGGSGGDENVYFTTPLENGDYIVEVDRFSACSGNARYTVSAYVNGNPFQFSAANQNGEFTSSSNRKITIGVIRIQNGVAVQYNPNSSPSGTSSSSRGGNPSSSSYGGSPGTSGSYCVIHMAEMCFDTSILNLIGYDCSSDLYGIILNYCPANYDNYEY